jgi:hypothetical protein
MNINKLHEDMTSQLREQTQKYSKRINDLQNEMEKDLKKFDEMDKSRITLSTMFQNILVLRQSMNVLLPKMWEKYEHRLNHADYKFLASNTQFMIRKDIINKDVGSKFALAIIHHVDKSIIFPEDICISYVKMNDKFHPKITPIVSSIQKITTLKNSIDNYNIPILQSFDISREVLDHMIIQLNSNQLLFEYKPINMGN